MKAKKLKIKRSRVVEIAANHNCVSMEVANAYTNSELKEVLKHLKINAEII